MGSMRLGRIACYMAVLTLLGCSSLSEVERAEQALADRKADLNATQHEISRLSTSLLMLPKDSPPILDFSRRKDLLGRQVGELEKQVEQATTKLVALKPIATVGQPSTNPVSEPNPPAVPPPAKPGQPAVDPKTGLPAGPIPEPTNPEPEAKSGKIPIATKIEQAPKDLFGIVQSSPKIGDIHIFRITGEADGPFWGTDIYSGKSNLAPAAVHAGCVRIGETAVVRVTIVASPDLHVASQRNGVESGRTEKEPFSIKFIRLNSDGTEPKLLSGQADTVFVARRVAPERVVGWGKDYVQPPAKLRKVVAVAAGFGHSGVLRHDGTVVSWGGQGLEHVNIPTKGRNDIQAIAASTSRTMVLTKDGTVLEWNVFDGKLTNSKPFVDVVAIVAGESHSLALQKNGNVVQWGNIITPPPFGLKAVDIAVGNSCGLALKRDGTVEVWGSGSHIVRNLPAGLKNVIAIAAGYNHALALKKDGTVVGWGSDFDGAQKPPSGLRDVVRIFAGKSSSAAIKKDGSIVVWGRFGGFGSDTAKPSAELKNVQFIALGHTHGLAITKNDESESQAPATGLPLPPDFPFPAPPVKIQPSQVTGLRVGDSKIMPNQNTGFKYVVGNLHNEATQPFSRIKIEFRLYDIAGKVVGTASDTRVTELAPATVWPFQALVKDANAVRAELVGVSLLP